jgi:hypothetical protein
VAIQSIKPVMPKASAADGGYIREHLAGMHFVQLCSSKPSVTSPFTISLEHGIGATALTRLCSMSDFIGTFVVSIDMEILLLVLERESGAYFPGRGLSLGSALRLDLKIDVDPGSHAVLLSDASGKSVYAWRGGESYTMSWRQS